MGIYGINVLVFKVNGSYWNDNYADFLSATYNAETDDGPLFLLV